MSNRLADEHSLYLRQHADNPVDWWPWGEEALEGARAEGKPVLLSIGYSACHWCHVMAHESFENPAIAGVMNELFVNIKVDREQRPDLDKLYQLAHQALTGRGGGWPLTVFLDPEDRLPFFAGTYFPPQPRHGLPGFVEALRGVRDWYDHHPVERQRQNQSLAEFLARDQQTVPTDGALTEAPIKTAVQAIASSFDAEHGGHRGAPKFPHASELEFLFDAELPDDIAAEAREMACVTLARMAEGGLVDHLGGGFFRYCVDARWEIPHFEKMLYDNAQLLPLYARFACEHEDSRAAFERAVGWLSREMRDARGGFWSALDADSEGEEGRYYVWRRDQVKAMLDADSFAVAERRWGLDQPPNFESRAWHLTHRASRSAIASTLGMDPSEVARRLHTARRKLLAARDQRVRPGLDDKILTAWNALLIGALARSSQRLQQPALLEHADAALGFIRDELWRDGRLLACHAGGTSSIPAFLDDYAFLLDAVMAMLTQRWSQRDLEWACTLADALLNHFEDRDAGGFWFTADDAESLPQRSKSFTDDALPSGNGIAARALLRLGHLLGETRYLDAAERCLRAAWSKLEQYPHACCSTLLALGEFLHPRTQIVVRAGADELAPWNAVLHKLDQDHVDIYRIDSAAKRLPGALTAQEHREGGCAWVCTGTHCLPPITEPLQLADAADSKPRRHPGAARGSV